MEVVGANVALHTIHHLVTLHQTDPSVKRLLDAFTFYVLPCVNPDGAEQFLTTGGKLDNSTARPWNKTTADGIDPQDLDGDGRILAMRYRHPAGDWKVSDRDPRLMVARRPDEHGGEYYRVRREGRIVDPSPHSGVRRLNDLRRPDLNVDFPSGAYPPKDIGSRPRPFHEPEAQAVANFVLERPNICCVVSNHSFGDAFVMLNLNSEPAGYESAAPPMNDAAAYRAFGDLAKETTGYEPIYLLDPELPTFIGWCWNALGIWSMTPEIWNMHSHIMGRPKSLEELQTLASDEDAGLKILEWIDGELGESGFAPWTPFDHPELGKVEIGGFDWKFTQFNPPVGYLPEVQDQLVRFYCRVPDLFPSIHILAATLTPLTDHRFMAHATIANTGFLPTYLSFKAKTLDRQPPPVLSVRSGDRILASVETEHLEGRANGPRNSHVLLGSFAGSPLDLERTVELSLEIPEDVEKVELVVSSQCCGSDRLSVTADR